MLLEVIFTLSYFIRNKLHFQKNFFQQKKPVVLEIEIKMQGHETSRGSELGMPSGGPGGFGGPGGMPSGGPGGFGGPGGPKLPVDLIVHIASYFSMKNQRTFLSQSNKSFRTLMKTRNLIRYKLSNQSCRKYVNDLSFRDLVDSRGRVWEFSLNKHTLLSDLTFLSRVHSLTLTNTSKVTDVSALKDVHTLTLEEMSGVTDVSALGRVHTLKLCNMPKVTDVSALGRGSVHNLTLEEMSGVTDVSALGSVHTLNLLNMRGVTDVSNLGSVHILTLEEMSGVTDVSALGSVHFLCLWSLDRVKDLTSLGNVKILLLGNLSKVTDVTDVSGLQSVKTIVLWEIEIELFRSTKYFFYMYISGRPKPIFIIGEIPEMKDQYKTTRLSFINFRNLKKSPAVVKK
jgi:hypothetical protein